MQETSEMELISMELGEAFAIEVFVMLAIGKVIDTTAKRDTFVNQEWNAIERNKPGKVGSPKKPLEMLQNLGGVFQVGLWVIIVNLITNSS